LAVSLSLFLFTGPGLAFPSSSYVIRKGDTLYSIAKRFHVSQEEIRAENGLKSNIIKAGASLRIPEKKTSGRAAERPNGKGKGIVRADSGNSSSGVFTGPAQVHRVRPGDTLWSLSRRYDVRENDLRRLNRLREGKDLQAGTLIIIREALPETYTVEEGDSLVKIAGKFGMKAEELKSRNEIDSDVLTPGMWIALFGREEEPESTVVVARKIPGVTEGELAEAALPHGNGAEPVRERAVRVAKKMLNIPYAWGGTSLTGMDCSGFVWKVFAMLEVPLPRSAREQYQVGRGVDRDNLLVGDLVFFRTYAEYPSHVGIYLGNNQFIHMSSKSRYVKISPVDHPYYTKRYIGARRLFPDEDDAVN